MNELYVIKNAGSYFSGWVSRKGRALPSWSNDPSLAVRYSSRELSKFKTLSGFRRLGTVSIYRAA
jgi:hypothetical protein